jgi:hypothetical protein
MAAKARTSPYCEGISGRVLGVGENQADLELVAVADGEGAATVQRTCKLVSVPHVAPLVFNEW